MSLLGITTGALSAVGSIFAQKNADGKVDVALGPVAVVMFGGLLIACSVQSDEPFSRCVITIGQYLIGS